MLGFSPLSTYPVSTIASVITPLIPTETDALNAMGRLAMLTTDPRITLWPTDDRNQLLENDDSRLELLTTDPRTQTLKVIKGR